MDLDRTTRHLTAPLVKAAAAGDLRMVQVLLEAEADVDGRLKQPKENFPGMPDRGWCALSVAAYGGHEDVVDALLRAGAAVRPSVISEILTMRSTPSAASAPNGGSRMMACVTKLATRCRRIDMVPAGMPTPLWAACSAANPAYVKLLLAAGADPARGADAAGRLPIHALVTNMVAGHEASAQVMQMLLDRRPELVDATDNEGMTPMDVAVRANKAAAVSLLVRRGANLSRRNAVGRGYLDDALDLGHTEIAIALIEAGAPLEAPQGKVPYLVRMVQRAVPDRSGVAEQVTSRFVLEALLKAGADTEVGDPLTGSTALHWAVETNNPGFARLLLEHGADVMAKDGQGFVPQEVIPPSLTPSATAELRALLREAVAARTGEVIESAFTRSADPAAPAKQPQATMTL